MGRARGKPKKLATGNYDDPGSGEEEKIPVQRRRGRPQKPLKDEIEEEEANKIEEDDVENAKAAATDNGRKRKQNSTKERIDSFKEELGSGGADDPTRSNGFRHNGSRRKNKPRRAAEAGVECN